MNLPKEKLKKVNPKIIRHVEKHILPKYETKDEGHSSIHILDVINRIFELNINLELGMNEDMLFVIASYHDLGRSINDQRHEELSAELFMADEFIQSFFTPEECLIIAEAIADHRASLKGSPRNDYGKLVSSADRNTNLLQPLQRTYAYRKNSNMPLEDKVRESYKHLVEKFGESGYAGTVWYDDGVFDQYLKDLREILKDYDLFRKRFLSVNAIDEYDYYTKKVNHSLKKYIETTIFPKYSDNDVAHGLSHIKTVIIRSFELCDQILEKFDPNIVYTIAAYHDLGKYLDHENHEQIAADLFFKDPWFKHEFSEKDRLIISAAIADHRSSYDQEPRNNYGKLISSADRNTSIEVTFKRSFAVGKWRTPNIPTSEFLDFNFERLRKRYSVDNPENMFYQDPKYLNYLTDIRRLLQDKKAFIEKYCAVNKIENQDLVLKLENLK